MPDERPPTKTEAKLITHLINNGPTRLPDVKIPGVTSRTFLSCRDRGWIRYIPQVERWHAMTEGAEAITRSTRSTIRVAACSDSEPWIIKFPGA